MNLSIFYHRFLSQYHLGGDNYEILNKVLLPLIGRRTKKINKKIKQTKLQWIAGETSVSKLTYEEKKKLFGSEKVPNLQAFECYLCGIFEIISEQNNMSYSGDESSSSIEAFDWRNRHGANNPNSPYYDGNVKGNGWISSVKNQGSCGSCWAFCAVGATEAFVNLYYNKHLDEDLGLDLSEQDVLCCSHHGTCSGGSPYWALWYISCLGVVDEDCFPYTATDQICNSKWVNPSQLIDFKGFWYDPSTDEDTKRALISHGSLSWEVYSWNHCIVLVGFERDPADGQTVWIIKNSWGEYWGEDGYARMKWVLSDINWYYLFGPVNSTLTFIDIDCRDADFDGYYN